LHLELLLVELREELHCFFQDHLGPLHVSLVVGTHRHFELDLVLNHSNLHGQRPVRRWLHLLQLSHGFRVALSGKLVLLHSLVSVSQALLGQAHQEGQGGGLLLASTLRLKFNEVARAEFIELKEVLQCLLTLANQQVRLASDQEAIFKVWELDETLSKGLDAFRMLSDPLLEEGLQEEADTAVLLLGTRD